MRIVFMGTPEFAVPILRELIKENYHIILVVTQPDRKVGRSKKKNASPVKAVAMANQIEVFQPENLRVDYQRIVDLKPDLIVTAAYGQMVPDQILVKFKSINIHGSILPSYRGGAPIQKAIMDGRKETGITIMYMAKKMDAGDILYQEKIPIDPHDDYGSLSVKLSNLGTKMLIKYLPLILSNKEVPLQQERSKVSFAYTIKREDEIVDFTRTTAQVLNHIRGLAPMPGVTTYIGALSFKIYKARESDIIEDVEPGVIISVENELIVKTHDGSITLETVQLQGKKQMGIKSFLNGQQVLKKNMMFSRRKNNE